MIPLIQAERGKGMDDLLSSYMPGHLEEAKRITIEGNNPLVHLLKIYEKFLYTDDLPCLHKSLMAETSSIEKMIEYFKDDVRKIVLTPAEISAFLVATIPYEKDGWYTGLTGIFVSVLIQQSYRAGNNQFYLDVEGLPKLDNLAVLIQGTAHKPIEVSVSGNIGGHLGHGATYALIQAASNYEFDFVGCRSQNSTIVLKGDMYDVGFHSEDTDFIIHGNVKEGLFGPLLYEAQRSTCSIDGSFEGDKIKMRAKKCIFRTPNKKTYAILKKQVPTGNRVIFLGGSKK